MLYTDQFLPLSAQIGDYIDYLKTFALNIKEEISVQLMWKRMLLKIITVSDYAFLCFRSN